MTNCSLQSHRHKACAQSGCGLRPCSPHSPSRPTRATQSYSRKRLMILKMAVSSTKMATGSPCRVFSKTSLFLKTRYALPLWSPSWLPAWQCFAPIKLNEWRLLGLMNPSTNISRRLAISLRPSARLLLSKTAPLHWFSKNETLIYNCQFPTIYQPSILSTETTLRQFLKVCPASPDLDLRNSLRSELILMWFNLQMQTWFYKVLLRQLSKVCPASPGLNLKKQSSLAWFYRLIFSIRFAA